MAKRKEVKESTEPTLEKVENEIISKVVSQLAPEMNKAIQGKFEEMKTVFMNELKEIRGNIEQRQQSPEIPDIPNDSSNMQLTQPQEQAKAGLEQILPLIQMIGGNPSSNSGGGLGNMFMEAMMRKSLADITRGDMMNEVMMKAMYKKLLGDELPDEITKTTDKLMSPLRKFGNEPKL